MYTVAGYIYDISDNIVVGATVNTFFIKRKSGSSSSFKKQNPIISNVSGYFSVNLNDLDFLTTNGKYETGDELVISVEKGNFYVRVVHTINTANEYNAVNIKNIENKKPVMAYTLSCTGIVGEAVSLGGSSYKDEASFSVDIKGLNVTESQKRMYDTFDIFPKNSISSVNTDWGNGVWKLSSFSNTYASSGNYTITVKSVDGYGYENIQTFNITEKYKVTTNNVCDTANIFEKPVKFTSVNSGHVNKVTATDWYCDGVKIGSGNSIDYTFLTPGNHKIKNVVYYDDGFNIVSCEKENTYLVKTHSLTTDNVCNSNSIYNQPVKFTSINSGDATVINKTKWYCDGIKIGEGDYIDYMFLSPGVHAIKNMVYYSDGFVEKVCEKTNQYNVWKLSIGADFSFSPLSPFNEDVIFNATYANTTSDSELKNEPVEIKNNIIKTDVKSVELNRPFRYNYYGTYDVTLEYTFWNGWIDESGSLTKNINVRKKTPILYDFDWTPREPTVNDNVKFFLTNKDSQVVDVEFFPGSSFDGTKLSKDMFIFKKPSRIKARITFFNDWENEIIEIEKTVSMGNVPPVSELSVTSKTKTAGEVILTSEAYDIDGKVVEWDWKITDKNMSKILMHQTNYTDGSLTWYCTTEGIYVAILRVKDSGGDYDEKAVEFEVKFDAVGGGTTIKYIKVFVPYGDFIARYNEDEINVSLEKDDDEIKINISVDEYIALMG